MRKLEVACSAIIVAAVGALSATTHVAAAGSTRCSNQTLGAVTVTGNLVVPSGAFCNLAGTTITGSAEVEPNGGLLAQPATIDGNVVVERGGQFAAFSGSTIGGSVWCSRCGVADLHSSTVTGSLIDHGMTLGAFIESSQIHGSLVIKYSQDGGAGFTLTGNSIGGNLDFDHNRGTSSISTNTIAGELDCWANTPPPAGSGNTASAKEGQCAGL